MTGQGTGEAARTHQPVNEQGTGEAARAHHGVNEQAPRAPLRPYGRWLGPKRVALILLLGFLIRLPFIGSDTGITNDTRTFVAWAHAIRAQGVTNAYVRTGIDYPPFSLYLLAGAERLEARLPDDLRRGDRALIALTKLPAVLADLVLAGLVMGAVRRRREALPVWLTLAGLLYVLHPAVWYVSAYWGQTDSVYTLFVVMAVMAIARGAVVPAWLVYTLALASKLQAIAIAPVLVVWTVTRHGVRGLALGLAAAGAAAAILLAPWLRAGNIGDVLTTLYLNLPTETPKVDVDAFNGWYLALLGNVYQVSSWRRPFDLPISFEAIGVGLFGLFALGMTGLIWRQSARTGEYADPYMAAAVLSLGMFMLLTQMHERYLFPVIPLLLLSAVEQDAESDAAWGAQKPWPIAWVYLVLSLTFFFNLISTASFVPSLWISIVVPQPLSPLVVVLKALSFVAAIVNVLVFGWLVRDAIARERVNATTR